ncbi:ligase-associated DNA damage response endonuclease PdeM [Acetobacter fallax]|uniref:Ligase-associated DNA damage response endonuclease PdeM n=1 Tax=Acetobacter fallax TaxID=1737473 RepID=A0ABX0KAM5_9PROT|nr:ligase-associated DNA damage response endonuclease PdeM [Acetobacter fallax]NHO33211.1 ligase-associated DNA damage response endonuclease PdeM [Acetobacter fallax]NHO36785.1 ligase-associated DNA damage response endonuclease PdeM [Acetobacter fallax]
MTTPTPHTLAGETLLLLPEGAIVHPASKTLIVADLHLEKSSSRRDAGLLLPPYDTGITLDRLTALATSWRPERIIALGDSFHDNTASERLSPADRARLTLLGQHAALLWLTGNHDPIPPADLPGIWKAEHQEGTLLFRHIPTNTIPPGTAELAGHLHPKARITLRGHTLTRPCFVMDETRVLLPAFGTYTGGLDVQNPAISQLFTGPMQLCLLGKNRLSRISLPARVA